ncbi:aminotransferase class IV [Rubinisphaera italica]|uniref:Branched-chain-amino-acid aminotransferase n=1 Tax=Rubinisphaera italica TaxID=2527969 RepID=A0A5C5XAN8_9PLAN|nr:aminotransferase class IV [Rubinisphaera italica]TWT60227.1 Branched-chain-amino-acid aminotransferase [Rubinisphaera italica]
MKFSEPIACLNGQIVKASDLRLPVTDMGIVHGIAVTEMLRTFRGALFEWKAHWGRFQKSAELTDIPLPEFDILEIIEQMVIHNIQFLPEGNELGVIISATAGPNRTYLGQSAEIQPTFFAHTFELPGELWANATELGQHLAISSIPQISPRSVPPAAKVRSRMNWYLAERDVSKRYPGSRPIVLDEYGFVRETSTANLFAVRDGYVLTAPEETVLPGICRAITIRLLHQLGAEVRETNMTVDDLLQAQEIFTTSTPYCLMGVSRLNSASAGLDFPGEITRALIEKWNQYVGLDIHEQLRRIAFGRQSNV